MAINLLPQDLKPKGYAVALAKNLRKLALISLIVFLVGTLTVFSIFIFYTRLLSQSAIQQENLKAEIKALQETEQKLILLKDRIDKFTAVENPQSLNIGVNVLDEVSELFPEGISFKEVTLSQEAIKVAVYSDNLQNLSRFILSLAGSGKFKSIYLVTLSFKPTEGYSAEFGFVK